MAANMYRGIKNIARIFKRMYIGVNNKAKPVRKAYIGVDGIARLCFEAQKVVVSYVTSLTASFSSKTVYVGDLYPVPTVTPANSNREDFWFPTDAVAKKASTKKYIDYPWYAYADANPDVYATYGYKEDLLAKHWNEIGRAKKLPKGDGPNLICKNENDHELQHIYRPKAIAINFTKSDYTTWDEEENWFAALTDSKGNYIQKFYFSEKKTTNSEGDTEYIYELPANYNLAQPDMKLKLRVIYKRGLSNVGSDGVNCAIKLDGTKVISGPGTYTYTIPKDIKAIKINFDKDDHWDVGESWILTATTTKF